VEGLHRQRSQPARLLFQFILGWLDRVTKEGFKDYGDHVSTLRSGKLAIGTMVR
jgi:hypothetical protein